MERREDYACPLCKNDVGPPLTMPTRCLECGTLLVIVRVIGSDRVLLFYRVKRELRLRKILRVAT